MDRNLGSLLGTADEAVIELGDVKDLGRQPMAMQGNIPRARSKNTGNFKQDAPDCTIYAQDGAANEVRAKPCLMPRIARMGVGGSVAFLHRFSQRTKEDEFESQRDERLRKTYENNVLLRPRKQ